MMSVTTEHLVPETGTDTDMEEIDMKWNKMRMGAAAMLLCANLMVLAGCGGTGTTTASGTASAATVTTVSASASTEATSDEATASADTSTQGAAPAGSPPDGGSGGASATVDHGSYATLVSESASGTTYASTGDAENAVRIEGASVTLTDVTVNKTAGVAASGDTSNFYGSNAGLLALDGATVVLDGATVTTSVEGANGIFSYGEGTTVTVNDATIRTTGDSAGGVMVTGGGTMYVNDSNIDTQGAHSAALRTDRGGGTLVVDGGTYVSHGVGSPAIYSTADITVSNATLTATGSEAVVVEGKNSVALKNCSVTGTMAEVEGENLHNIMIYQSMSGDADSGTSAFDMEGGSLTANAGDMFYVTNTQCTIRLSDVGLVLSNDVLLRVAGNSGTRNWGTVGSNGGTCAFTAEKQEMGGKIIVDEISGLTLSLTQGSVFTGSINEAQEGGNVAVTLDASSKWVLTGDSYVTTLSGETGGIDLNGHVLYVNGVAWNG